MFLQVIIATLKEWRVTEGCHGNQEIFVGHPEFAIVSLDAGKDFERFLGRGEEANFVLVFASDDFCAIRLLAESVFLILLLLNEVGKSDWCQ